MLAGNAHNVGVASGVGAAWTWKGQSGQALDETTVQSMQRFLSKTQPRIRALGGARFEPQEAHSVEWEGFGSYMFMIPRLAVS